LLKVLLPPAVIISVLTIWALATFASRFGEPPPWPSPTSAPTSAESFGSTPPTPQARPTPIHTLHTPSNSHARATAIHTPHGPSSRRPSISPERLTDQVELRLADNGYSGINVTVQDSGRVTLEGDANSLDEEKEIESVVRRVPGVGALDSQIRIPKGWMGLGVHSSPGGVIVEQAIGPARRAGVKVNDLIVAIDGQPIQSEMDFKARTRGKLAGETVTMTLPRSAGPQDVQLKLKKKPF
jgi:hypothetical protein